MTKKFYKLKGRAATLRVTVTFVGKRSALNKDPHLGCTLMEWDVEGEEGEEEEDPARADKD